MTHKEFVRIIFSGVDGNPVSPQKLPSDIEEILKSLDESEKTVLKLKYGLFDGKEWTSEQIANHLGQSVRWVVDVENEAICSLRFSYCEH